MNNKYGVWASGVYVPGRKHRTYIKYDKQGRPVRVIRRRKKTR